MNGGNEVPTKEALYHFGLEQSKNFLRANALDYPEYISGRAPHAMNKWQNIGLYVGKRVWVDVGLTTTPRLTKGRVWSWPAYKVDRTAAGVVAHETGHYVADIDSYRQKIRTNADLWHEALKREKPVSGYEPVPEESFAEAMRLYILNPDLLRSGWPMRAYFIEHILNLTNPIYLAWWDVLKDAPYHIKEAAAKCAGKHNQPPAKSERTILTIWLPSSNVNETVWTA